MGRQSVSHSITQALELDSRGETLAAYIKYHDSLSLLLSQLSPSSDHTVQVVENNLVLARNCLDRLDALVRNIEWASIDLEQRGNLSAELDTSFDYLALLPTTSHTLSTSASQRSSLTEENTSVYPTRTESNYTPPAAIIPPSTDLSALRHKYAAQLVTREKEKSLRVLRAKAGIVPNTEQFIKGILQDRRKYQSKFNEKVSGLLANISRNALSIRNSTEIKQRRKSIKQALEQSSHEYIVLEPLMDVFFSRSDPISELLRDLCLSCQRLLRIAETEADPSLTVNAIMEQISLVEYHLVEEIFTLFEEESEDSSTLRLSIKVSIQKYIFSTAIASQLMRQWQRVWHEKDVEIFKNFATHSWENVLSGLKVKSKFSLEGNRKVDHFPASDLGPLKSAIDEARGMVALMTPTDKLLALSRTCSAICQAYENGGGSGSMGSEDLLMMVAYVLVRAQIPHLNAELTFISKFVPEELLRGEAGYAYATVQTSLDYAVDRLLCS